MDSDIKLLVEQLHGNKSEIYRYLGYSMGSDIGPSSGMDTVIDEVLGKLCEVCTPHSTSKVFLLEVSGSRCHFTAPEEPEGEGLEVKSTALSHHLAGCSEALLFSATIGPGVDALIRRYSGTSMTRLAIVQASGAALIEAYADTVTGEIKKTYPYLKPRFSPGYGDFALKHQTDFFRLLQLEKRLGLSLNDAFLMTPSKSITAVIGISDSADSCATSKCAACPNISCEFRQA